MDTFITKVEIIGLHNRFDICQEFRQGINIIYGDNGDFKTTLLHVIANLSNNDFERFLHLTFNQISIHMNNGIILFVEWRSENRDLMIVRQSDKRRELVELSRIKDNQTNTVAYSEFPLPDCAYFPTSRMILDAWFSSQRNVLQLSDQIDGTSREKTKLLLRDAFGQFMPEVNFSSVSEIIVKLRGRLESVSLEVVRADQKILADSFYKSISLSSTKETDIRKSDTNLDSVIEDIINLHSQIETYSIYPYLQLPKVVIARIREIEDSVNGDSECRLRETEHKLIGICKAALSDLLFKVEDSFLEFDTYLHSINSFFNRKRIEITSENEERFSPIMRLIFENGQLIDRFIADASEENNLGKEGTAKPYIDLTLDDANEGIQKLSSGEKQIISLLYAAHISNQEIVLVDEPEISLHIDWQERLLEEMEQQLEQKQVIVCTHSPMIGSNYNDDVVKSMNITKTDDSSWKYSPSIILPEEKDGQQRKKEKKEREEKLSMREKQEEVEKLSMREKQEEEEKLFIEEKEEEEHILPVPPFVSEE